MRILHVYKDFDPPVRGGIERHMALMCRFQRQWADVSALTCSRSLRTRNVTRDGAAVLEVGEWGRFQNAPVAPGFLWHLPRRHADVNVIHVPNPTAEVAWLLTRPRGKLVVRYHSDVVRQAAAMRAYGPVLMQFLRKADMILVGSQQYLSTSETLRPVRDRCRILPFGIEVRRFANPDADAIEAIKKRYGGRFVFFSGRHRYYKGLRFLVQAASNIHGPVVIAGDGPERAALEALNRDLGADARFIGELTDHDLVTHLHAADVFAFPSTHRSEAFGISILEAHAAATPVVATTLGTGVEFANLHEQTGLNVPPGDPSALAGAINRLLSDDRMRQAFAAYAQHRVATEFDAETIARHEFDLYSELLDAQ